MPLHTPRSVHFFRYNAPTIDTQILLVYLVVLLGFVLIPGPAVLLALARGSASETRIGFVTGLGIAVGDRVARRPRPIELSSHRRQREYVNHHDDLYRGTCQVIAGDMQCVRNRPIVKGGRRAEQGAPSDPNL